MKLRRYLVLVGCLWASSALGWGGHIHMAINYTAAGDVPNDMKAWREYNKLLGRYSIEPDLWKSSSPQEGVLHYIDVERYRNVAITNLPNDRAQLEPMPGRTIQDEDGIAPWAILDLEQWLTQAMASNDWIEADRVAAAMGHYVGDLHQPLHNTEHYNGNFYSTNGGIHSRWEESMPGLFWQTNMIATRRAHYLEDPWSSILDWIVEAHRHYPEIYQADEEAALAADGDCESEKYYRVLWKKTSPLFMEQTSAAAQDLASLWYTAWVNAGRPTIPPPPSFLPSESIWPRPHATREALEMRPFITYAAMIVIATCVFLLGVLVGRRRS